MLATPVPHGLSLAVSKGNRSAGLHLSEIYNDLYQRLEPKRFRKDTPMDPVRLEMGMMFEDLLERAFKERLHEIIGRPDELVSEEGIIGSPDLFIFDADGTFRIGEIKLTWMSSKDVPREPDSNGFPPKFNKYFTQIKGYCHMAGTQYARLIVLFVNGDGKPGLPTPELLAWDLEFSPIELQENWTGLVNHAMHRGML